MKYIEILNNYWGKWKPTIKREYRIQIVVALLYNDVMGVELLELIGWKIILIAVKLTFGVLNDRY